MKFGLKVHPSDMPRMGDMRPDALELVLFPRDLDGSWVEDLAFDGPIVLHMPDKFADGSLVDLASPVEDTRRAAVSMLKRTIRLASSLKAESIVCHPGGIRPGPEYVDTAPLLASMRELRAYAGDQTRLLLENMPSIYWYNGMLYSSCIFRSVGEVMPVLETLNVGLCLDLCHAKLYCNATGGDFTAYVNALKPYTSHIHVSDARGRSDEGVQIGEGEIDFMALTSALKGLDVIAVPEILDGHKDGGAGFRTAVARLRKIGFFDGDDRR